MQNLKSIHCIIPQELLYTKNKLEIRYDVVQINTVELDTLSWSNR